MSDPSSPVPAPPGKEPHRHEWKAHPGPEPDYRKNGQMWHGVRAYVMCASCGARTWLSPEDYAIREVAPAVAVPAPEDRGESFAKELSEKSWKQWLDTHPEEPPADGGREASSGYMLKNQRQHIDSLLAERADYQAEMSRLRSQQERMRVEAEDWKASHGHAAKLLMRYREDLLTPEEAGLLVDLIEHTPMKYPPELNLLWKKLRRRLSSDSEIGDTKP